MPTTLTLDVEKDFEQFNGTTYTTIPVRYVAAYNPVLLRFIRKDWEGTSQESTAIPGKQAFDIGSFVSELEVGDLVYVIAGPVSSSAGFAVTDITGTVITINFPWSFGAQFGYVNIMTRQNWYLSLTITAQFSGSVTLKLTPSFSGIITAEISGALQSFMDLEFSAIWNDLSSPSYTVNERDFDLSKDITLSWKENWIGSDEAFTIPSNEFVAVAGSFNIGNPNNGFYIEYYPNDYGSQTEPDSLPKWLTFFDNPFYWSGFFFTKSLLIPDTLTSPITDYRIRQSFYDVDGVLLQSETYIPLSIAGLNQVQINPPDPAIVPDNVNRLSVEFYKVSGFQYIIKRLDLKYVPSNKTSCNNFYVRWLNPLGGWEYWLFEHNIYEGQRVESLGTYQTYFEQLADTTSYQNSIGKRTTFVIQCGTDVFDENTAKGLRTLSSSPKVEFLNQDTDVWIGVQVVAGSFQYRKNKQTYNSVELSFELPTEFNQTA